MNGLKISREYFEKFGKPMLETEFTHLMPFLAVGFVGSGSEHYGFDDEVSRDHDYEPGFNIFLPNEDIIDREQAFALERAYAKLPKEYAGLTRKPVLPVGGNRHGVIRTSDYYFNKLGTDNGELSIQQWLTIPDYALAEAVNGEVFFDNYGEFSKIREYIICMPEDIRLKRLAGNILIMAQSGQYNFGRCLKHGEPEAAQLACIEFVNFTVKTAFLLQNRYAPYYKWSFRALRQLYGMESLAEKLSVLLYGDCRKETDVERKKGIIEEISSDIIGSLREKKISDIRGNNLEEHAYSINNKISDGDIRNMNILVSV